MAVKRIKTGDPVLQGILDAAGRSALEQARQQSFLGEPTDIKVERYDAAIGELVLCDPTTAAFTVSLPKIEIADIGKVIYVINVTGSTNTITIKPDDDSTINGSTSDTIAAAYGIKRLIAVTSTKWVR